MKRFRIPLIAVLLCVAAQPCAVDSSPRFVPRYFPEVEDSFLRGQLGILSPALGKKYELIAWRYLTGRSLNDAERAAFAKKPAVMGDSPTERWRLAHGGTGYLIPSKSSTVAPNTYYVNCLDDAFDTATATYADRKVRYRDDTLLRAWAAAQDKVFENCSGDKPVYPEDPGAAMPVLARADRMYQIAAAHFYAEDFAGARERFQAISKDPASPWQATARYLVARTLLREAVLAKRAGAATEARTQLIAVASDSSAGRFQGAAKSLSSFADSLIDPGMVIQALSRQISDAHPGPAIAEAIRASEWVMQTELFKQAYEKDEIGEPFAWVRAIESMKPDEALRNWLKTPSEAWLAAALMNVKADDAQVPALLTAASKVAETSPAFDTVTFHSLRLLRERGRFDEARVRLDALLSGKPRALASVDNAYRAERMALATGFDDFLRWAPRRPIGFGEEYPDMKFDNAPTLDSDSIDILNSLSLKLLVSAAESNSLPLIGRQRIALIALTRALILRDNATAARLVPVVVDAHPQWAGDLKEWNGATGEEKQYAADLLIARHSELETKLWPRFQHEGGVNDGWWCADAPTVEPTVISAAIASAGDVREAASQRALLRKAGAAQTVIAPSVMSWAAKHPGDPRVPESLYRLVRMTRYGCRTVAGVNGPISKAAFDLLHRQYPNTDWARKTPYWFKD